MSAIEAVVLDRAPAAIVVLDSSDRIVFWNGAAERLYGWTRSEATGKTPVELGIQPHASSLPPGFRNRIDGGQRWEGLLNAAVRTGSPVTVFTTIAPLHDANGTHVGSIAVALDAEQLRAESAGAFLEADRKRAIGRRIAEARRENGLTQKELAEALGVTRRSVQGYEAGAVVPYRHLHDLGRVLSRDPRSLLAGDIAQVDRAPEPLRQIVRDELKAAPDRTVSA